MARWLKIEKISEASWVVDTLDFKNSNDILKALLNLGLEIEIRRVDISKRLELEKERCETEVM